MEARFGREVLQARILGALFKKSLAAGLALKGGMAMRAAYGSVRYTKDLDIAADPILMSPQAIARAVESAISEAVRSMKSVSGVKVTAPKQTDTTQRWKVDAMVSGTRVHLTVEVSRRDALPEGGLRRVAWKSPHDAGPEIPVDVYRIDLMAASKLDCLCNPNRAAPRDLWDLSILIKLGVEPSADLVRRIGKERLKVGLEGLWAKIEGMDHQTALHQLLPFLDGDGADALDEDTWDEIRMDVYDRVSVWMRAAMDGNPWEEAHGDSPAGGPRASQ